MAAISDPNFAKVVVRGYSSRREGWISKEERRRKDRGKRKRKKKGTRTHSRSMSYKSGSLLACRTKLIFPKIPLALLDDTNLRFDESLNATPK